MTELVLALCETIVKTAFKLWAGDNVFAESASEDLADLINSQVPGALERRKVRTQFGKIEEIVADQLLALLNAEFRNLDESEKNAAILAVTETFDRARLTDKALFDANLDPLYLAKTVRRFTGDAAKDLSFAGVQLYDRLLAQCCAYIIEIADKLPRFQAGAFAELLNRDAQIMARLTEVLERLPVPAGDGSGADRVETAYRQLIAKRFDRLELFGLDFAAQWYELSIAYVNLSVAAPPDADDAAGADAASSQGGNPASGPDERFGPGSGMIEDWLARYPRLLIEGRPGGGKTTILQWIAVRAALGDFTGAGSGFNEYTPFFLRLREYVDGVLPPPERFLDTVASLLAPEAGRWPRHQLRSGRALVLVDGMDEVSEARRPTVLAWLRELTDLFPQVRYVVTTRPKALQDGALAEAGFVQVNLEPMNPRLVRIFIEQWHAAMREWQKDTDSLAQLDDCRAGLVTTLDDDRFLSELASTPLLAGLVCALNHHLNAQLPRRRGEIFEKALAMFHERDRKRGVPGALALDLNATNHLLGDLALWMVRNARVEVVADAADELAAGGMVAEDSARDVLRRSALSLPTRPGPGTDLYGHLLLRSGLLREQTAGHVDFVHRTFQEYLAAKALIRTDRVGEIITHADDDQWREVVILASGQGNVRQATELLQGLMRARQRQRSLLAVACLGEIRAVDPGVLAEIDRAIPALLPPQGLDEAEALSHAGAGLIRHLARRTTFGRVSKVQLVIRTAALVGGPEALNFLSVIVKEHKDFFKRRGMVVGAASAAAEGELIRVWRYFEPEPYAKRVLIPLVLESISVTRPRDLPEVAKMPKVNDVTLDGFPAEAGSLFPLDGMMIRSLTTKNCDFHSLEGILRPWPGIGGITLERCNRLEDISSLALLPNLQELSVVDCGQIKSSSVLGPLETVRSLTIKGHVPVDLKFNSTFPNLTFLKIQSAPKADLRSLSGGPLHVDLHNVEEIVYPDSIAGQEYAVYDKKANRYLDPEEIAREAQRQALKRASG